MSLNPGPFEPVRLEFHAGRLFTGQDIKGTAKSFDDLKQAYQITILAKKKFFQDKEFFHSFEYYDPARGVSLNGKTRIITLELSKLREIVKNQDEMTSLCNPAFVFSYHFFSSLRQVAAPTSIINYSEKLKNFSAFGGEGKTRRA